MKIHQSIDKRVKKIQGKIASRYLRKLRQGKKLTYYYHPSFYLLYAKRMFWLLLALLTFKPSVYSALSNIKKLSMLDIFLQLFKYEPSGIKLLPLLKPTAIIKKHIAFKQPEVPLISIIIPVHNHLSYTYNCLLSIKLCAPESLSYEIIIVDDCSSDKTEFFFKNNIKGVLYIRNAKNLGYLESNNKAADIAKGQYLCLLNNDTEVQAGWLESLLSLMQDNEEIGCAGSKLIYPNNLLQEAGGIIYRNGNGSNFGRLQHPDEPIYNFIREVDYCSAASILIRKVDFDLLGKFDSRYAPAYYEDTDLCFAIRNILRKKVIYQPFSRVIHHEGITSGKEIKTGSIKDFQRINRLKFIKKWEEDLKKHDPDGYRKSHRRLLPPKTILVIEWSLPTFDKDSGSLRLFRLLQFFKSIGLHIIFIPEDNKKPEYYYNLMLRSGVEVRLDLQASHSVNDFEGSDFFSSVNYIWISRPELNYMYKDIISMFKHSKWIYDTVDLHYVRKLREAQLFSEDRSKMQEAKEMKELELSIARASDMTVTVTEDEKKELELQGITHIVTIPNIHITRPEINFNKFLQRDGILFIGNYQHTPNIDAVKWLVSEIMPIVYRKLPEVKLYLAGSYPTEEILSLQNNKIIVSGYVPDVSSFFINSRVFVCPLRYGAGMKGKIGQALEFKLPIVTTSIGAEGMGLQHEKHVLVADDKQMFAQHILRLYEDRRLWSLISSNAVDALTPFTPETVKNKIRNLFLSLDPNYSSELPGIK